MREEDLGAVTAIEKDSFSAPWSLQGFRSSLGNSATMYLSALVDGEIVGYCGLLLILDEGDITNVAVREDFRNRGVGKKMLTELLRRAGERGARAFTLEARKSNEAALALYRGLGFESVGLRKNFYEDPREDAVIMWKR